MKLHCSWHDLRCWIMTLAVKIKVIFELIYFLPPSNCESCIEEKDCGFCSTGGGNQGSCLRAEVDNEDDRSLNGRCNKTNLNLLDTKWSHGYCPTSFTWMAVLGLALFVLGFAPGMWGRYITMKGYSKKECAHYCTP